MSEYHKIQTVYKRDPATKHKTLLEGQFSLPEFEYLANNKWIFTEKVDGTNIRIYFHDGEIRFAGRTDRAEIPPFLLRRLEEDFLPLSDDLGSVFDGAEVCLYGEGYGARIQKGGGRYRPDPGFVLFDVMVNGWWLHRHDVEDVASKLGIEVVPVMGAGTLFEMVEQARAGIRSTWGDFEAEGYVARPEVELKTRAGGRVITKIKCRDFVAPAK